MKVWRLTNIGSRMLAPPWITWLNSGQMQLTWASAKKACRCSTKMVTNIATTTQNAPKPRSDLVGFKHQGGFMRTIHTQSVGRTKRLQDCRWVLQARGSTSITKTLKIVKIVTNAMRLKMSKSSWNAARQETTLSVAENIRWSAALRPNGRCQIGWICRVPLATRMPIKSVTLSARHPAGALAKAQSRHQLAVGKDRSTAATRNGLSRQIHGSLRSQTVLGVAAGKRRCITTTAKLIQRKGAAALAQNQRCR